MGRTELLIDRGVLFVRQRLGLHVPSDAFVSGQGVQGSAVVQTLDASRPLVAELSGESTEGVSPAPSWTLAEGATGLSVAFQEWITVFNPSSEPVTASLTYYGASGPLGAEAVGIPSGPGLYTVYVNTHWAHSEHSTVVTATGQDSGTAVPIVVERRMRWHGGLEGHSSPGASAAFEQWEFAEGGAGLFQTYVALFNPQTTAMTVYLYYRHENGWVYGQSLVLGAGLRAVVGTPSGVPAGGFAISVLSAGGPLFAERMMYAGTNWTIGHASTGARWSGPHWRFAEGSGAGFFDTYFLISNPWDAARTVTLTYRRPNGTVIGADAITVPAGGRGAVWANGTAGAQDFSTEVTSNWIVVERAMYWPTGNSLLSGGDGQALEAATSDTSLASREPPPPDDASASPPSPYTLMEGVPELAQRVTEDPAALIVGKPAPGSMFAEPDESLMETQIQSSGVPWYGSHVSVGKKP